MLAQLSSQSSGWLVNSDQRHCAVVSPVLRLDDLPFTMQGSN